MTNTPFVLVVALLLGGCANGFTKFYQDKTGSLPAVVAARMQPYSGSTNIYSSNDLQRDEADLIRRGYIAIGEAAFQAGGNVSKSQLMEQAKRVGADIVICSSKFDHAEQAYVPVLNYQPGQTSTTYSSGTATASAYGSNGGAVYGSGQYNGSSTTTTPGTFTTSEVPVTVRRYDYAAIFWRRGRPPVLGVSAINLPDNIRMALKRNTGALISVVLDDSPAFRANLIPGDILIKIDETSIDSALQLSGCLPSFAGKDCVLTVLREGKETNIPVKMNSM